MSDKGLYGGGGGSAASSASFSSKGGHGQRGAVRIIYPTPSGQSDTTTILDRGLPSGPTGTSLTSQSFSYSGSVETIGPGFIGDLTITMRGGTGGTSGGSYPKAGGAAAQLVGTYTLQSTDVLTS